MLTSICNQKSSVELTALGSHERKRNRERDANTFKSSVNNLTETPEINSVEEDEGNTTVISPLTNSTEQEVEETHTLNSIANSRPFNKKDDARRLAILGKNVPKEEAIKEVCFRHLQGKCENVDCMYSHAREDIIKYLDEKKRSFSA